MTPGARIQAAIELLDEIERQPADEDAPPADAVLNAYFRSRRYIGAKDRRAIGDAVFQTLRQRGYIDWLLTAELGLPAENRFRAMWTFAVHGGISPDQILAACDGSRYHPAPLPHDQARRVRLLDQGVMETPPTLAEQASIPAELVPEVERQFGADAWAEMIAFTQPAPTDLRVNTLKATREQAAAALAQAGVKTAPTRYSPIGLRLETRANLFNLAPYRNGWIEVQDESSQLAALLVEAKPGMRVLDLCAGAGGKTLALAAAMGNRGRIIACDVWERRLARMAPRIARGGARIIKTVRLDPQGKAYDRLGAFDRVMIDAPCTGSGTWRRRPETKWRLTRNWRINIETGQHMLLDGGGAPFVRPNGRLIFATCSILPAEGRQIVDAFLADHKGWRIIPADKVWRGVLGTKAPFEGPYMLLTPHRHGTDGFFLAILAPP